MSRIDLPVMPLPPEPPPEDESYVSPAVEWIRDVRQDAREAVLRRLMERLEQLRAGLITAPEQRVADEALALVKGLLEEQ